MKKNLMVRTGAVAAALTVAFFSIVPDLVNAEGEGEEALAGTEVVAQAEAPGEIPEADMPEDDTSAVEAPPTEETDSSDLTTEESGDDMPETETPEEGDLTTEMPVPGDSDGASDLVTKDEESSEPLDTEAPSEDDPTTEVPETETPETEQPTTEEATENQEIPTEQMEDTTEQTTEQDWSGSEEMDTVEDYIAMIDDQSVLESIGVATWDLLAADDMMAMSDEEDFVIDGTVVVGYKGIGGFIAIPDGITAIADSAFAGNTSITGVSFPGSLQSIGSSAFNGCSNIESMHIPENVTSVGASAFANCTGLSDLGISASAGAVAADEFANCISLQSVTVPEGISSIASGAFSGCSNLSSISLPSTLTSLDLGAFSGDVSLASISVASGSYSSYDGCVYSADSSQLLLCPQGKTSISFAPGTQSVASGAFLGCGYILSAELPSATSTVEANAFSGSALRSVTIPAGVTTIGSQAGWTPNVIYGYSGSEAERWADNNNYVFESLSSSSEPETEKPISIEDPDPDPTDDNPGGGPRPGSGGSDNPQRVASPGTTGGSVATVSKKTSSRVKDATPKTGVEDYKLFFLFGGAALLGFACFAYSRKLRLDGNR